MVNRVAQKVRQRGIQFLQNVAVNLRLLADDFEPHFFSKLAREVADHSWKVARAVAERTHPALQNLVVEPLRNAVRAVVESFQFGNLPLQKLAALGNSAEKPAELDFRAFGQRALVERFAKKFKRAGKFGLKPLQSLHRIGERLKPSRFDQRFTRQTEQAIHVFRRQTKDACFPRSGE